MKRRNSIKVAMVSILVLGTVLLGLIGCATGNPSGTSLADVNTRLGTLESWKSDAVAALQARPTRDETNSLIASAVANVNAPNLSNYATDAELQSALDNLIANLTPAQITALKTKLGLSTSTSTSTPSGKVSAEITDAWGCDFEDTSLLGIYSGTTTTSYRFTVSVTNNTGDSRWVYCSIILTREAALGTPANVDVTVTKLTNLSYSGSLTYSTAASPADGVNATTVTFTPIGSFTRFSVGAGKTVEVDFLLEIKMSSGSASWFGSLMHSASSTP